MIEVVSPGHTESAAAFEKFTGTCRDFIGRGIHLLVVDPFPSSQFNPHGAHRAIWDSTGGPQREFGMPALGGRLAVAYEADRGNRAAHVQPLAVGTAIPDMPLYLGGDDHVMVPLEAAYQSNWTVTAAALRRIVETGVMPGDDVANN